MRAWDIRTAAPTPRPAQRLLPCPAQLGHELGDDQHDHGVDREGDPVLGERTVSVLYGGRKNQS